MSSFLPEHNLEGINLYIHKGILPGSFLQAVLRNDLQDACARADDINRRYLWNIVAWLYNHAPANCWGSPEKVAAWVAAGGLDGRA